MNVQSWTWKMSTNPYFLLKILIFIKFWGSYYDINICRIFIELKLFLIKWSMSAANLVIDFEFLSGLVCNVISELCIVSLVQCFKIYFPAHYICFLWSFLHSIHNFFLLFSRFRYPILMFISASKIQLFFNLSFVLPKFAV